MILYNAIFSFKVLLLTMNTKNAHGGVTKDAQSYIFNYIFILISGLKNVAYGLLKNISGILRFTRKQNKKWVLLDKDINVFSS